MYNKRNTGMRIAALTFALTIAFPTNIFGAPVLTIGGFSAGADSVITKAPSLEVQVEETETAQLIIPGQPEEAQQMQQEQAEPVAFTAGAGVVTSSVDDMTDDIIDEGELYNRLCTIIFSLDENKLSGESVKSAIRQHLADYKGPLPDSKERLFSALRVMVTAYIAAMIKRKSERLCNELLDDSTNQ